MNACILAFIAFLPLALSQTNICLSRNATIQSLIEGVFHSIDHAELNTTEYKKSTEGAPDLYVWYHNQNWFLSPTNYSMAMRADASSALETIHVYGYCRGGLIGDLPACEECWRLYWEPTGVNVDNQYVDDCSFELSGDMSYCEVIEEGYDGNIEYPEKLCVNPHEDDDKEEVHDHPYHSFDELGIELIELLGTYEKVKMYPYYMHTQSVGYMWHDVINNHWAIGIKLNDPLLLCIGKREILTECVIWDAWEGVSKPIDNLISVSDSCEHKKALSGANVIEIIVAIVVTVVIIAVIVVLCLRYEKKEEREKKKHKKISQMETVEIAQATSDKKGKDTYDMSPLNADDDDVEEEDPNIEDEEKEKEKEEDDVDDDEDNVPINTQNDDDDDEEEEEEDKKVDDDQNKADDDTVDTKDKADVDDTNSPNVEE
eukprot:60119_1